MLSNADDASVLMSYLDARSHVLSTSAVPALIKLLPLRHEATQEAAARTLHNLALDPDGVVQAALLTTLV